VTEEQVRVEKAPVVKEEITVGKRCRRPRPCATQCGLRKLISMRPAGRGCASRGAARSVGAAGTAAMLDPSDGLQP
jgi:hypothetical protein